MTRHYFMGEEKWIEFVAHSRRSPCDQVVIEGARFRLLQGEREVQSGDCVVDGPKVGVLLFPPAAGDYVFELTYTVADETRMEAVDIHVA